MIIGFETTVQRMVASLEKAAAKKGVSLSGITVSNFNTFLDDLFDDGGETRCLRFVDLADGYALQFGKMESVPFDTAHWNAIERALTLLEGKYTEGKGGA